MSRVKHADMLRGATTLAVGATKGVTQLVEDLHCTIASGPALLGSPLKAPASVLTRAIYGTLRDATDVVGAGIETALAQLAPLLGDGMPGPQRQAVVAALNGVFGDYLEQSQNPLAISMELRSNGVPLRLTAGGLSDLSSAPSSKVLVLVHGSCMHDRQWRRMGHDHGLGLSRDCGYTPLYLCYNSGRHISTNGADLANRLERLADVWPVPVEEFSLIGHSMGGLVARSACASGEKAGHRWRASLRRLFCLGSPHHGAPLERAGSWVEALLGTTSYTLPFVRLAQVRSAGVTDLRYGNVLDEHWEGQNRFAFAPDRRTGLPLPSDVACYAIAASKSPKPCRAPTGDGLVSVDSALGRHRNAALSLAFPQANQSLIYKADHLDLLGSPDVYARLRAACAEEVSDRSRP